MSTPIIARRLKRSGVIRSELAFRMMVRVMGESGHIKAGEYRLPRNLGLLEVIDRLVEGAADARWVVVPEGKRVSEVARIIAERNLAGEDEFVRACGLSPSRYGIEHRVPRASLEGYLMPDTYRFASQVPAREIVREMTRNWRKRIWEPRRERFRQSDLTPDQIVIVASLIEREARVPEDRPLISSVIRNRLRKKMRLEIDATVLYALGDHKPALSLADLKVPHPSNTYLHKGLPPGPICSPGAACIDAALDPARTEYLYYVAMPDGSHRFARTYQEHRENIALARAARNGPEGR